MIAALGVLFWQARSDASDKKSKLDLTTSKLAAARTKLTDAENSLADAQRERDDNKASSEQYRKCLKGFFDLGIQATRTSSGEPTGAQLQAFFKSCPIKVLSDAGIDFSEAFR